MLVRVVGEVWSFVTPVPGIIDVQGDLCRDEGAHDYSRDRAVRASDLLLRHHQEAGAESTHDRGTSDAVLGLGEKLGECGAA